MLDLHLRAWCAPKLIQIVLHRVGTESPTQSRFPGGKTTRKPMPPPAPE